MRPWLYLGGLAAAVSTLALVDRSASDIANQAALAVLLAGSAALGFSRPKWAWLAAIMVGSTVPIAHLIYLTWGPPLPYPPEPPGRTGALTLFILVVPALAAAYAGAGLRLLARRDRR